MPWCDGLLFSVRYLTCGVWSEDAEEVGFDEGPKPAGWVRLFEERGIVAARDVCCDEAASVLWQYAQEGGAIY